MILGFEHSVAVSVTVKAVGVGYLLGFLYSFFMLLNSLWNKYSLSVFFRDAKVVWQNDTYIKFIFVKSFWKRSGYVRKTTGFDEWYAFRCCE